MKLLSIGNSFSQDAHRWLHWLAAENGVEIEAVNLFIGGCSLQTHWENAVADHAFYELERNGGAAERMISIGEALQMETWDVITLQQVSSRSGLADTYVPYLKSLADMVRRLQPQAKLYFHQTWAYECDSTHPGFSNYNREQQRMYGQIVETAKWAAASIDAELIPVGTLIQRLRETVPAFDYGHGGKSLCRDGFHLTLDYGRYAAAAAWLAVLSGKPVTAGDLPDADSAVLAAIRRTVNQLLT